MLQLAAAYFNGSTVFYPHGSGAFMPSVHEPGRYAGMHVQFDTMVMQMNEGSGKPPVAELLLFPYLFSAVSNFS